MEPKPIPISTVVPSFLRTESVPATEFVARRGRSRSALNLAQKMKDDADAFHFAVCVKSLFCVLHAVMIGQC